VVTILWPLYESATESPADASGCYCTVRPLYAGQGAPLSALAEQFRRAIVVSGRFTSSDNFRFARQIGIGAAVTRRPLPHHRAYGSVHGGSSWLR
jgi:hypothetical protein